MKAIMTKYLPATNTKPSRIKAIAESGKISIEISYNSVNDQDPHEVALIKLCKKFNLHGTITGQHLNNDVMVWVFKNPRTFDV